MNLPDFSSASQASRASKPDHGQSRPSLRVVDDSSGGDGPTVLSGPESSDAELESALEALDGGDELFDADRSWRHRPDLPGPRASRAGIIASAPLSHIRLILRELDSYDYDVDMAEDMSSEYSGFFQSFS